ncbi:MAG: hypothetical protein EAX86_10415 [Candidatus Heimdallarchaeota archaeon]|nr:hypothetical protein [Candidatus Heimdallarchaeota archaeon]
MLIFGLFSFLIVLFGVFLIFVGILGLLTIAGKLNTSSNDIFNILFSGLGACIVGAFLMIIYSIGMKFLPPLVIPEPEAKKDN